MDKKRKISKNQSTNLICCGNPHSSYNSQSQRGKNCTFNIHPIVILTQLTVFFDSLWFWPMSYFIISNMVDQDWYTVGFFPPFCVDSVLACLVICPLMQFGLDLP